MKLSHRRYSARQNSDSAMSQSKSKHLTLFRYAISIILCEHSQSTYKWAAVQIATNKLNKRCSGMIYGGYSNICCAMRALLFWVVCWSGSHFQVNTKTIRSWACVTAHQSEAENALESCGKLTHLFAHETISAQWIRYVKTVRARAKNKSTANGLSAILSVT